MNITFDTKIVDVSVALKALALFRKREYREASRTLQDILDYEPKNWQARLMLGVCYFKTQQYAAASRVFRFIYENCPLLEEKQKAFEAFRACTAKEQTHKDIPAEFGCYIDRKPQVTSWLDGHPTSF
jgi:thioredoxin-like negative regulator of GroEL